MIIRNAQLSDAPAIAGIYNYYIENTVITFEEQPVTEQMMEQRMSEIIHSGFPFYVGEEDGKIAGYYYLHLWNKRSAYALTREVSIYLDQDMTGKGLGTLFYEHLFKNIDREKIHTLIAGITIPNEKSIRLHERFGFKQVSLMKEVGWKFGAWRDVGYWQLIFSIVPESA